MELDHLKNLWNEDQVTETPEISLEEQNEIHLPLEKIRKNMRMEFWSSVIIFVASPFLIWYYIVGIRLQFYFLLLVISAGIVTVFYYLKFFALYNDISDQSFSTREMLRDLKNQFYLNKQYYISYYLAYVPFLVATYILVFDKAPLFNKYPEEYFLVFLLLIVVGGLLALYFLGKVWFKHYYGKYISQIEQVCKQLK